MHAMRNRKAEHVDYGFMAGWIEENPKAMPSNIDGVIERNGCFLWMEWKHGGESMSKGQQILLSKLAQVNDFFVIVITGYSNSTGREVRTIQKILPDGYWKLVGESEADLKVLVNKFYNYAEMKC
jgi:hypothetical protein